MIYAVLRQKNKELRDREFVEKNATRGYLTVMFAENVCTQNQDK